MEKSKVSLDLKDGNIVPINKGGNKEEPTNYRPVSLISVVVKLCKKYTSVIDVLQKREG